MAEAALVGRADEHRFFTGLALAMLGLTVLGFSRTYLLVPQLGLPPDTLPFTPLVHLHAAVAFGWCLLFAVQAWLVASGRTRQHRKLGLLGVALYVALVLLGPFVAINSVARYGAPPDELAFLAVSVGNIVAYTSLFGAAFYWRRRPDVHKRLMVLGMVAMLTAPFGRLLALPYQLDHVAGPGLVAVALVWWDYRALGRMHAVTYYGAPAIVLWELLPNMYMNTPWWMSTAQWLVSTVAG
ncbi:MAG: hypothetical protein AB7O28_20300 [Vicinamibacterales bacterium]